MRLEAKRAGVLVMPWGVARVEGGAHEGFTDRSSRGSIGAGRHLPTGGPEPGRTSHELAEDAAARGGGAAQVEALRAGDVNRETHMRAYDARDACLVAAGVRPEERVINRVDGWSVVSTYDRARIGDEAAFKIFERCSNEHVAWLDIAMSKTHGAMEPELLTGVRACLADTPDVPKPGNINDATTYSELVEAAGALEAVNRCVTLTMRDIAPGETYIITD